MVVWAQAPSTDIRNTYTPNTDTHFTMPEYKTLAQWEARKAQLRQQILSAAGLNPMPEKTPLNAQIFGRVEGKDYTIEKVLLETWPGFYLGGNLYRPLNKPGRHPGIASPHGHWNYGRLENSSTGSIPARCINFAKQGYVAFCYDMVGYNDTLQTPHRFRSAEGELWAFGPLGLQLWDSIRVIDFLQSLPDVDPERIGMTGASGGGTQTFLLTAVDDRVKWSAPVNMISGIMQGGCVCENAPNLRVGANNIEIGAMMAPRPLMMVSATGDWTKNTPREEYPAIKHIYELYGKPENVEMIQIDAPHNYNKQSREAVYRFFGKFILGDTDASHFTEKSFPVEPLQNMLALMNRKLPSTALTFDGVFDAWKAMAKRQADTADRNSLRERMRLAMAAEWPAEVSGTTEGERIVLTRPGKGDRVPGLLLKGQGNGAALLVAPGGADSARQLPQVKALQQSKAQVLLIDAFQTGSAVAPRDRTHEMFLTFNKSDDANRVQDILTGLRFLNTRQTGPLELVGLDRAAVWALFAAAVTPVELRLSADTRDFHGSDQEFIDRFFVPDVQRAGGLKAAMKLTEGMR